MDRFGKPAPPGLGSAAVPRFGLRYMIHFTLPVFLYGCGIRGRKQAVLGVS